MCIRDSANTLVSGPDIHARGFAEDDSVFDEIRPELAQVIERALKDGVEDTFQVQQLVRRTLGRWVSNNFRRRPMILPIVVAS